MKVILITQARMGSSRLPGKVLMKIEGRSLLEMHIQRATKAQNVNKIIVATSDKQGDHEICQEAQRLKVTCFRGSEDDVLDRFYQAAKSEKPDYVVRLTADCPLIDPLVIDAVVESAIDQDLDYCMNSLQEWFPDGQDTEVFKFAALERAWKEAKVGSEREHVTPYIYNNSIEKGGDFKVGSYDIEENLNHIRMTVDEKEDFEAIETLVGSLGVNKGWREYTDFIIANPDLFSNQRIIRNEGYLKSLENDKSGEH
ncbi:glycosyltransferase family protein [uncultured Roseivirga sp.]|uniref:glycosyltransferase family protein n=1 Tax=uncultured Roseivirga sp. TaxID=543088 RepID=UPI0030D9408A|tara:strand:+ start:4380 stop:5144 length:765 start_codon:yes stop_codon:yes gene_type:complete